MATAKKPTPRTSPFSTTNQTAAFNPPRASFSTTTPTRRTTTGTTSTEFSARGLPPSGGRGIAGNR